jgi:PadR family transcriptional regulator, regulatory protein PadR
MDAEDKLVVELRRGVLQIAALALMRHPAYGYQLLKDLAAHGFDTEEGTLYPILRRLEQQGFIAGNWDTAGARPRKYYEITDPGRAALAGLLEAFRGISRSLDGLVAEGGKHAE